ncbi:MAG: outer rane lipoprotein carrier protein LolA [Candidatus Angelobacter sp.]|nr:outer rane lipoprotein carrier protein LolA [Candidatus Angelobacter sp.]
MKLRYSIPAALVLLLCGLPSPGQSPDVRATARAVDEHYNHLKTFKAAFTEIYQGDGISRTESGTLWLKKPSRMRWEYHAPREKLFLIDSQTAYFYVTGDRQAKKTPARNLDDLRSPLRYLLGKTKLEKELEGLSLAPDLAPLQQGDLVMRGVPKIMKDRISEVVIEVSPAHQIHRIVIHGVDSTITDFRFSLIEENVPVQDSLFRFTPPPGVDTIEDSQVTQ